MITRQATFYSLSQSYAIQSSTHSELLSEHPEEWPSVCSHQELQSVLGRRTGEANSREQLKLSNQSSSQSP